MTPAAQEDFFGYLPRTSRLCGMSFRGTGINQDKAQILASGAVRQTVSASLIRVGMR